MPARLRLARTIRVVKGLLIGVVAAASVGPARADEPAGERARRALEAAGALDEQAQRAGSLDLARAKWREAIRLLDECVARDPTVPQAPAIRFQAALYAWASRRAVLDQVDLLRPGDPERVDTAQGLDDVIDRLRAVATASGPPAEPFAQNVRFRLAQAIADRARLRPELELARFDAEKEAAALLDRSIDSPRLKAFARLLHAELANRLGQYGPAQVEAEEVERYDPPPPAEAVAQIKINALTGRGQFAAAVTQADRAPLPVERKALWKLRVARARRQVATVALDRAAIEAEMFALAEPLREGRTADARRGLMELARALDEPGADAPPDWWDLLAEGHLLLREPDRAARFAARGADRAEATRSDRAAALRYKAGACWFQAERYADADADLALLLKDRTAPASLRAKAGMLLALARGRALAAHQPGSSRAAYLGALEAQVRDFPDDPASGEAHWLLGKVRAASNRRDEALALWAKIPHGQPRWLDAQASAADLAIAAVEDQWINRDLTATRPRFAAARDQIRRALDVASAGDEAVQIGLRLARLDLIAGVGQAAEAHDLCDRIVRGPASSEQHREARLGRLVALAEQNRFAEAEAAARNEAKVDDLPPLLAALRLLDQTAAQTDGDLIRTRTAALIRILVDRRVDPIDQVPVESRDEVRLRHVRALIFGGDTAGARRALARWGGISADAGSMPDPGFLRDLADTYVRLEAYPLAVDVERLRVTRLAAGSPAWFDARYGLALALFRSDRAKEARKLIDATTILHPDLGGGETRAKFERLGQKIGAEAN